MMTYYAHNGSGPGYLAELIQPYRLEHQLNSASEDKLHIQRINIAFLAPDFSRLDDQPCGIQWPFPDSV